MGTRQFEKEITESKMIPYKPKSRRQFLIEAIETEGDKSIEMKHLYPIEKIILAAMNMFADQETKISLSAQKEYEDSIMLEALKEIAEGKGRFSLDKHEHAKNTIEDMRQLALDAIKEVTQ